MNVLVVVTAKCFKDKLWERFFQHPDKALLKVDRVMRTVEEANIADANVIRFHLNGDGCVMVMFQEQDDAEGTARVIVTLLKWAKDNVPFETVYIAARLGSVRRSDLQRMLQCSLPETKIRQAEFLHHYNGRDSCTGIFKALERLAQTLNEKSFETTCELIKKIN